MSDAAPKPLSLFRLVDLIGEFVGGLGDLMDARDRIERAGRLSDPWLVTIRQSEARNDIHVAKARLWAAWTELTGSDLWSEA